MHKTHEGSPILIALVCFLGCDSGFERADVDEQPDATAGKADQAEPTEPEAGATPKERDELWVDAQEGSFRAEVAWSIDPGTQEDVVAGFIEFIPSDSTPACESLRFVQIAKVRVSSGEDYEWPLGEAPRNEMRTIEDDERGILGGFYVDHSAFLCRDESECSPYFRDHFPNPEYSRDGTHTDGRSEPASLMDFPFGWSTIADITLEACARCVDTGEFLGCVDWGAYWPLIEPRGLLPIRHHPEPSPTFWDALERFERYYEAGR